MDLAGLANLFKTCQVRFILPIKASSNGAPYRSSDLLQLKSTLQAEYH